MKSATNVYLDTINIKLNAWPPLVVMIVTTFLSIRLQIATYPTMPRACSVHPVASHANQQTNLNHTRQSSVAPVQSTTNSMLIVSVFMAL